MNCTQAQEEILASFEHAGSEHGGSEHGGSAETRQEIDRHLAGCPACAGFAARQRAVDARLNAMLIPPRMSPAFRPTLRKRLGRETMRLWPDSLPGKVHFLSCGGVTLACACLLPLNWSMVLGAGAMTTVVSYVLLTLVQGFFDDAEEPGQ